MGAGLRKVVGKKNLGMRTHPNNFSSI